MLLFDRNKLNFGWDSFRLNKPPKGYLPRAERVAAGSSAESNAHVPPRRRDESPKRSDAFSRAPFQQRALQELLSQRLQLCVKTCQGLHCRSLLLKLTTFSYSLSELFKCYLTSWRPFFWSYKCLLENLRWKTLLNVFGKPCGLSQPLSTLTDPFKGFQAACKAWLPPRS